MNKRPFLTITCLLLSLSFFAQKIITRNPEQITKIPAGERIRPAINYDFSNIRICMDKHMTTKLPPKKEHEIFKIPRVASDGKLIQPSRVQQGLTVETDKMWAAGDTITVGFYKNETTDTYINKVKQYAREWENYANIKFLFVDNLNNALVKVGFVSGGSWSMVGRDVLDNSVGSKTMNFGWLKDNTPEADIRQIILHEFGHALGFIHEHNSPLATIPWDKEKVYAYFGQAPDNWSREMVDVNVFKKYATTETNYSSYDKLSIMHYFFPTELTSNQTVFYANYIPSAVDIRFAGIFYPFPVNPSGTLHTGDDCDEIDFHIEYNVVHKHLVEFILEPGIDKAGNRISWWKQIAIPAQGGVTIDLELAPDGKSDRKMIGTGMLDKGRMLSFAKAKALGVHTGLGFKWDILPAVIGGCRVKLTWRNDHCY